MVEPTSLGGVDDTVMTRTVLLAASYRAADQRNRGGRKRVSRRKVAGKVARSAA
jgi:hypothetical protein